MEQDNFMSRGYLLPPGCKDLVDVLNLKAAQSEPAHIVDFLKAKLPPQQFNKFLAAFNKAFSPLKLSGKFGPKQSFWQTAPALPPVTGQIVVSGESTAEQLAALLAAKTSDIVGDVMQLGFFVSAQDPLSFEIISSVARKHGYLAIRAAA